jgi:competence protein ComEC
VREVFPRVSLGPFFILAAVVLGITIGATRNGAGYGAFIAVACLLVGGLIAPRWLHTPIACVAFMVLSSALTARSMNGLVSSPLSEPVRSRSAGTLLGAVVGDPDVSLFSTQVLVRAEGWVNASTGEVASAGERSVLVRASADDAVRLRSLDAGDRVALSGHLSPLDGYDKRWRWRHVVAQLDGARLTDLAKGRAPLLSTANWVRALVARGGRGMPARERGVLAGFLLGDKRAIPSETLDTFRTAGMSHLLVVSGANVAAVLALVKPLLSRAPIASRLLIGASALVIFGAATRWEPSVLRAIMMAVIVLAGETIGRPIGGVRVLCIAAVSYTHLRAHET